MPSLSFMVLVFIDLVGIVSGNVDILELVVGVELFGEAGFKAFVADAGANWFCKDEQGIEIAIGPDLFDGEEVAGGFSLEPELVAGAREEAAFACFECFGEGGFVHETDHEDALSLPVLDDGSDEAVEF